MARWFRRARASGAPSGRGAPARPGSLFDEDFQRRLEYLALVSRRVAAGRTRAERRSAKVGSGIEFADYREYVPGDDFRALDWNVYQRLGRLLVRLREEEEDLSVYLLLDVSASMAFGAPSKLDYARRVTAALAYVALANLDRVCVVTFSDGLVARLPPTRGKSRIFTVFEFLEAATPTGTTGIASAMRAFAAQHKRRGLVALVSDLYDPVGFEEGVNALRYAKFEPYVLQVTDPAEARPPLRGDLRLVDRETGQARDVTVTDAVLRRYEAAHRTYVERLESFCTSKQVPYFALSTGVPFDEAVLGMLRRGGLVA